MYDCGLERERAQEREPEIGQFVKLFTLLSLSLSLTRYIWGNSFDLESL